jgi:Tfp pilus assembly protein PilO
MSLLDPDPDARLSRLGHGLHVAGLGIAAALFAAVYIPAIGALDSEQARIATEIDVASRLATSAEALREEHRTLQEQQAASLTRMSQLLGRIPDAPQESEFLAHIARLAREAPLSIGSFRPIATRTYDRYSEVEVELSVAGRWDGLCQFLAGLETLPRLCRVSRLSIASESSVDGMYPADFTFVIYFAPARQTERSVTQNVKDGGAP